MRSSTPPRIRSSSRPRQRLDRLSPRRQRRLRSAGAAGVPAPPLLRGSRSIDGAPDAVTHVAGRPARLRDVRENDVDARRSRLATLHLVGSANGTGRTAAGDAEAMARSRAAIAWMRTTFAVATQGRFNALMLITQANPRFEVAPSAPAHRPFARGGRSCSSRKRGRFAARSCSCMATHITSESTSRCRCPRPRRSSGGPSLANFTRVETFGPPDLHWIRVRVVPGSRRVFVFEPEVMP